MATATPTRKRFQVEPLEERFAPAWLLAELGLDSFASSGTAATSQVVPVPDANIADLRTSVASASRDVSMVEVVAYDGPERRRKPRPNNRQTLLDDILYSLERRFGSASVD